MTNEPRLIQKRDHSAVGQETYWKAMDPKTPAMIKIKTTKSSRPMVTAEDVFLSSSLCLPFNDSCGLLRLLPVKLFPLPLSVLFKLSPLFRPRILDDFCDRLAFFLWLLFSLSRFLSKLRFWNPFIRRHFVMFIDLHQWRWIQTWASVNSQSGSSNVSRRRR